MTYSELSIQRVRVESFRGFRDRRDFDLSASAVIITGPNGTGKTSFFDALQWCFIGTIQRLENLRARRSVEHIVNQYRLGHKAVVEIELLTNSGPIVLRRSGDHRGSTLELRRPGSETIFGPDAEANLRQVLLPETDLSLETALMTSGLMQQDVMRSVLEANGADRYRHISTVLGLSRLEEFEDAARLVAREALDTESRARDERDRISRGLTQATDRLAAARSRLESRPQFEAMRDQLRTLLTDCPSSVSGPPADVSLDSQDNIRRLAEEFARLAEITERLQSLARDVLELQASLEDEPTEDDLDQLRSDLRTTEAGAVAQREQTATIEAQLDAAQRAASDLARLAALAIPLLTTECPVCSQSIDSAHVEAKLRERIDSTTTIVDLQESLTSQRVALHSAEELAATARDNLQAAELRLTQWEQFRSAESEAQTVLDGLRRPNLVVRTNAANIIEFAQEAESMLNYLRSRRRRLLELLNAFDQHAESGAVERATAEINSLESTLATAETLLEQESARSQRLQVLAEQSVAARVEVTERRVKSIQPLVVNIFQRLDPHPAFKTIEFELDTYYRRGTTSPLVRDAIEGVSADPLVVFSTSQANIVALSYFIAMSLSAAHRGLPFLLLDDPVQSMDDVNVLGFADLCRHLRSRRQLIVSTHERRFAALLERKLAPRTMDSSTKLIRFAGWDRSGPSVDQGAVEPQLLDDPIKVVGLTG